MFGRFWKRRLKLTCRSVCDRGLARPDNQDSLFADAKAGLFCVADGMGGCDGGAVASRMVCEALAATASVKDFDARIAAVDAALVTLNGRIAEVAKERGFDRMGSTVAALLVDPVLPARAAVVHLGDSRVYRRRGIRFERLTEDHRTCEYSHLLTRAVGAVAAGEPDWLQASVLKGDVWLVCSDGVHEMLPDSTLNALLAHGGTAADIAARLEASVRRAGARDNYSFVVVCA